MPAPLNASARISSACLMTVRSFAGGPSSGPLDDGKNGAAGFGAGLVPAISGGAPSGVSSNEGRRFDARRRCDR